MKRQTILLNQFNDYQKSEESFFVSIMKVHAINFDTKDKWIAVVAYDCY